MVYVHRRLVAGGGGVGNTHRAMIPVYNGTLPCPLVVDDRVRRWYRAHTRYPDRASLVVGTCVGAAEPL